MAAVLALVAALCWGLGDFLLGVQARRSPILAVAFVGQFSGFILLGTFVLLRGVAPPPSTEALVAVAAGAVGAVVFCLIVASLAMGNMARVAPIFSLSAVVPVAVGLARGEAPASLQVAGIFLALAGVVLVSVERKAVVHQGKGSTGKAMAIAAIAAIGVGSVFVGLDRASEYDPYWATLVFRTTGVILIGVALATYVLVRRPDVKAVVLGLSFTPLILFGVLDILANSLWAVASTGDLLSVVAVLGSVFPVVTVLLAVLVLSEPLERHQVIGVVATLVGSALITVG